MKNEQEKSDPSIVAKKPANKPEIAEFDLWGSGAESAGPREKIGFFGTRLIFISGCQFVENGGY